MKKSLFKKRQLIPRREYPRPLRYVGVGIIIMVVIILLFYKIFFH